MTSIDTHKILEPYNDLPRFEDGRIDFHTAKSAPVVNVVVMFGEEILLLKRSDKVMHYQGMWNSIGGFIDEPVPLEEKVREELREELGVTDEQIKSIIMKDCIVAPDSDAKTWHIYPARVDLIQKIDPILDWEHTEFRWVSKEKVQDFDVLPGLLDIIKKVTS